MLVKDVMKENPVTIQSGVSVLEAKDIMDKNDVARVPVVDKSGSLVGIITSSDLAKVSPSDATTLDMFEISNLLSKMKVEKVMIKSVKTCSMNEPVEDAARLMADYKIGCLPVVNEGVLVGIVSATDLFAAFVKMFSTKEAGVRAILTLAERPGVLAELCASIAEKNANIVALVTSEGNDLGHRVVTVKVTDIDLDSLKALCEKLGAKIDDIRNV